MPPKQAQDTSAVLSETFAEWQSVGNIATREDVERSETRIEAKITDVRAEIQKTKPEILYWMLGQTFLLLGALFGLFGFLHH